ncbi:MAG TPA: hypothetical protein VG125_01610 [Pirellulales bacterium]|jgi:hypothetical protein|nr:hypothetical protein [Pirellulales bacterium]
MPCIEGTLGPIDPADHVLPIFIAARLALHDSTLVVESWHTVAKKLV